MLILQSSLRSLTLDPSFKSFSFTSTYFFPRRTQQKVFLHVRNGRPTHCPFLRPGFLHGSRRGQCRVWNIDIHSLEKPPDKSSPTSEAMQTRRKSFQFMSISVSSCSDDQNSFHRRQKLYLFFIFKQINSLGTLSSGFFLILWDSTTKYGDMTLKSWWILHRHICGVFSTT